MRRLRRLHRVLFGIGLLVVLVTVLAYHAVDNSLTPEDVEYIGRYLEAGQVGALPRERAFDDEVAFIRAVQNAVLHIAPEQRGIADNQSREPGDLYAARAGLCFDRSRTIEKILRYAGFKARHVFILSTEQYGSGVRAFLTPGAASHAVTEVLTARGWLVVESNAPWVSLDEANNPRSMRDMRSNAGNGAISWKEQLPTEIYTQPLIVVYGLYSRHGRFFPPYNALPDVNYRELADNFVERAVVSPCLSPMPIPGPSSVCAAAEMRAYFRFDPARNSVGVSTRIP
jgi:hypothetical protein